MLNHAARLKQAIDTAIGSPVEVRIISRPPQPVVVEVEPPSSQAAAVVAAFDWSEAAHSAWLEDQSPERKAVRQAAANAIAANDTYIALASPTNAQNAAQLERLSIQMNHVLKRLIQIN